MEQDKNGRTQISDILVAVLKTFLRIILLLLINLALAVASFALFLSIGEYLDYIGSLLLNWLAGIGLFGLCVFADVCIYKAFYRSKLNIFVYIFICFAEYAGIVISVLSFIKRIAD